MRFERGSRPDPPDPGAGIATRCRSCGAHVTADFARVFGNNEDLVFRCPKCADGVELFDGAAAQG